MLFSSKLTDWLDNVPRDLLSGLLVALALIPEAIAFSIIAGVDPKIGLYASFSMAVVCAFTGGRPGMISAATGAMALLMVNLVKQHGLEYLLATTILTGCFQLIAGYLRLGSLMKFVSRSVVTGFVNALAILIFLAQMPELLYMGWAVYAMTALGLAIIYLFPVINKTLPSPLICIIILTIIAIGFKLPIHTVGDMGHLPDTLPIFLFPKIPLTLETFHIIAPYALALGAVGLLESMMTATIIDDLTHTTSDKNRECKGQGLANIATGFLGGMAGCAMIGQSMINIQSGGRGRLSTLTAGIMLLVFVVFLSDWVAQIPMAALVAVMIMVSISTFSWDSLRHFTKNPMSSNVVMLSTVFMVVVTHNLAYGVLVGVLMASVFFAHKVANLIFVHAENDTAQGIHTYRVKGQIFFASSESFLQSFDFNESIQKVVIDLNHAHFWDITAAHTLDKIVMRFKRKGIKVEVIGLNQASATIIGRFSSEAALSS